MVQAAQQFDSDPPRRPRLSSDEQRIADAVVAALQSELKPIRDTQEQHTKILNNIQQELRGINQILAREGFIPDNPDL